jgi:hypothetical protein
VFFEVTSEVRWSSPRAKNLAHRVAGGSYLFNLDADNRIGPADVALVEQAAARGEAVHQWAGNWTDGSFGRIGLPRDLYHTLGGYDESMLPMAGQDMDLLRRIHGSGRTIVRLAPPAMPAVQNTFEHKMAEVGPPAPVRAGRLSAVPRHQPDAVPGPVRPRRPAPAGRVRELSGAPERRAPCSSTDSTTCTGPAADMPVPGDVEGRDGGRGTDRLAAASVGASSCPCSSMVRGAR